MKLTLILNYMAKVAILLFAAIVVPPFSSAQSNNTKATTPPPPPTKASAPATAQRPGQNTRTPAATSTAPNRTTPKPQSNTTTLKGPPNTPPSQPYGRGTTTPNNRNTGNIRGSATAGPAKSTGIVNRPDGGRRVTTSAGHTQEYGKTGKLEKVVTRSGAEAHYTASGKVSTIRTANGTTITQGAGGQRQIATERRDVSGHLQSRVVSTGPNRGYVEHTFQRGGHEYIGRTSVYGGHTHVDVYRGYSYHGVVYYHYVPASYYGPTFYAWGRNPWGTPIVYTAWGWNGSPWYASYGYYFAPYSTYPSAAFWLTDYVIAENLRTAYEAGAASTAGASNPGDAQATSPGQPVQNSSVTLAPEVKQMIAEEVKAQLAAEQATATQGSTATPASAAQQPAGTTDQVPPALDPNLQIFMVVTSLHVTVNGQDCSLSAGDFLTRMDDTPDNNNTVAVSVAASQKSDCFRGSMPRIQVADLQEMHNRFLFAMDAGLKTLADNSGKNGLPPGPAANPRQNPDGTAAPDDATVVTAKLKQQMQDADQTEREVQEASSPTGSVGGSK